MHAATDADRRLVLQALVVRVMKTRRTLAYQLLVGDVMELAKARFAPTVPLVKRAIDDLLEKAYIERSDADKNVLLYVA